MQGHAENSNEHFQIGIALQLSFIYLLYSSHMMTSSNGNIFRVTGLCAGNSPVTSEFPAQRSVTRSFDIFSDLRLNKRLSKLSWGWWFETPSRSLWRHCNVRLFSLSSIFYTAHRVLPYSIDAIATLIQLSHTHVCVSFMNPVIGHASITLLSRLVD